MHINAPKAIKTMALRICKIAMKTTKTDVVQKCQRACTHKRIPRHTAKMIPQHAGFMLKRNVKEGYDHLRETRSSAPLGQSRRWHAKGPKCKLSASTNQRIG